MKYYKIYGATYPLDVNASEAPDAYAVKGQLFDEPPRGKKVGYVRMRDGSLIECYKTFNPLPLICVVAVVAIVAVVAVVLINKSSKDVVNPIDGTPIKVGDDTNVVTYNGFMAIRDGNLSVDFTNGNEACTIQVVGDGIECAPVTVAPLEYVASVPATFTTDRGLVQAEIVIKTETSESSQAVVIEIPENDTDNSPEDGLEGYWKGEYIYGTGVE